MSLILDGCILLNFGCIVENFSREKACVNATRGSTESSKKYIVYVIVTVASINEFVSNLEVDWGVPLLLHFLQMGGIFVSFVKLIAISIMFLIQLVCSTSFRKLLTQISGILAFQGGWLTWGSGRKL